MATESGGQTPRAIIHKRILDEASDNPNASLEALAEEVPGASVDLVGRVIEQYGDPVEEQVSTVDTEEKAVEPEEENSEPNLAEGPAAEPSSSVAASPEKEELTAKQRETLRQINVEPEATQEEIGEALGVTGATISNRLRDITGFVWEERQDFVSGLLGSPLIGDGHGQAKEEISGEADPRLKHIEDRLDALESIDSGTSLSAELAHKVIHVCMNSDDLSEEEELELIRTLIDS